MSQYVPKSAIPPEKVCPPQKEIDYSEYVKKVPYLLLKNALHVLVLK